MCIYSYIQIKERTEVLENPNLHEVDQLAIYTVLV